MLRDGEVHHRCTPIEIPHPERVLDVGRPIPPELLVEETRRDHRLPPQRHQVALDRVDVARPRLVELSKVVGHDPEGAAHAHPGIREHRLEAAEHVAGRFHGAVHQQHRATPRALEARVPGCRPPGSLLEPDDLDVVAPRRGLAIGDVGDHVLDGSALFVRAETRHRPFDVLVPALADPLDAHIQVGLIAEDGGDVASAPSDGRVRLDAFALQPEPTGFVDHRPARIGDPIAERVRRPWRSPSMRAQRRAPPPTGRHPRVPQASPCLRTKSKTAASAASRPLRVVQVPGALEQEQLGARYPLGELLRVLGRDGEVLGPVQHEGRDAHRRETLEAVEALHRLPLSPPTLGMFRLRSPDPEILGNVLGLAVGEPRRVHRSPRFPLGDLGALRSHRVPRPRVGAPQDQGTNALGPREGHLLRHHPAERLPVDVGAIDPERIQQRQGVVHERRHRRWAGRLVAVAVPAEVVRDDPELTGEHGDVPPPAGDVAPHAFEQDQRRRVLRAVELVEEANPVGAREDRHRPARPTPSRPVSRLGADRPSTRGSSRRSKGAPGGALGTPIR